MRKVFWVLILAVLAVAWGASASWATSESTFSFDRSSDRFVLNEVSGSFYFWALGAPQLGDTSYVVSQESCDSAAAGTYTFSTAENLSFVANSERIPRNITLTISQPAGGDSAIAAGSWIFTGTNILDDTITETLTSSDDTAETLTGTKAFKTLTGLTYPASDQARADDIVKYSIGLGTKYGLPFTSPLNQVDATWADGTLETTLPTVVFDADEIEKNVATPNTAADSSKVFYMRLYVPPTNVISTQPELYGW